MNSNSASYEVLWTGRKHIRKNAFYVITLTFSEVKTLLLSEEILSAVLPADDVLLVLPVPPSFFGMDRCMIRMGIPPKSKSSFKDFVKNLRSVFESCVFPPIKATKVGGRAFTWVKYLILGCAA